MKGSEKTLVGGIDEEVRTHACVVSVSWHSVGFFGLGTGDYRYAGLAERDEHDRWEAASAAGPEVRRSNGPRNAVVLIIRHAEDAARACLHWAQRALKNFTIEGKHLRLNYILATRGSRNSQTVN